MEKLCPGCMRPKNDAPVCNLCGYDDRKQNELHQLPLYTVLHGRYQIGKVLGQGGFGITYLGCDLMTGERVAIKEYYPSGLVMRECSHSTQVLSANMAVKASYEESKQRFLREANALSKFSYIPEIVYIKDTFAENNTVYIVMEYIDGITLRDFVRQNGTMSTETAIEILIPAIKALSRVHEAGFVHRDISPDNIMLLTHGYIKVLDFGAVRLVDHSSPEAELSQSTQVILKHGYAPIEQYQTRGSLGPWTDVYAMCATIYYCVKGCPPPNAQDRIVDDVPLGLEKVGKMKPRHRAALEQGLSVRAKDRIQSMEMLLRQLSPEPAKAEAPKPAQDAKEERRSAPAAVPAVKKVEKPGRGKKAILAVLASALLFCAVFFLYERSKNEEDTIVIENAEQESPVPTAQAATPSPQAEAKKPQSTPQPPETSIVGHSNVLMGNPVSSELTSNEKDVEEAKEPVFNTQALRSRIKTISFLSSLDEAPADAADASAQQDGSVRAWVEKNGELYDLFIAAEGGVIAPEDSSYLFTSMHRLESISFADSFDTSSVVNAAFIFNRCHELGEIDLKGFNTTNIENMQGLFADCAALTSLDLSTFDTSNVNNMGSMFYGCSNLKELDIHSFDTADVTKMFCMFYDCKELTTLDLRHFETSKVTTISAMFSGCGKLNNLDLSSFDTAQVTKMSSMFQKCSQLTELNISSFDTSKVTDINNMFALCDGLSDVEIKNFDVSEVTNYNNFGNTYLKINGRPWEQYFDGAAASATPQPQAETPKPTAAVASNVLRNFSSGQSSGLIASSLMQSVAPKAFNTGVSIDKISKITFLSSLSSAPEDAADASAARDGSVKAWTKKDGDMYHLYIGAEGAVIAPENSAKLFANMEALSTIDFGSSFDTSRVRNMEEMFNNCQFLTSLNLRNFDTSEVTDMSRMFNFCYNLGSLDLSKFDTSNVTDMSGMFCSCFRLRELNLSSFDTGNVRDMHNMFLNCELKSVNFGRFDVNNVENSENFAPDGFLVNGHLYQAWF